MCSRKRMCLMGSPYQGNRSLYAYSAQLSNADALSSYLFGAGKDARERLPVGGRFEGEVVGGAAAQLRALVAEHGAWLAANCARQVSSYRYGSLNPNTLDPSSCARWWASTAHGSAPTACAGWPATDAAPVFLCSLKPQIHESVSYF